MDEDQLTQTPASDDSQANDNIQTPNGGEVIINMEGMIKNYITAIDKLREEIKKKKEMLDDIFNNDPTFKQHADAVKEATKVKTQTKGEILKRPQAAELNNTLKTLKSELKENQVSLSDYLAEYQRMSGVNEIEGEDGETREIVFEAKLIKKFTPR